MSHMSHTVQRPGQIIRMKFDTSLAIVNGQIHQFWSGRDSIRETNKELQFEFSRQKYFYGFDEDFRCKVLSSSQ